MKTISLFSGCGGMDFGAQAAGAHIVFANDIGADACRTLSRCFPDAQVVPGDVRDITDFPSADLVIGGYPCQSFSMGGNRDPARDHRTLLYQEFARCLGIVRPRFFVAENVSGLKKLRNGQFLEEQVQAFRTIPGVGYRVSAHIVNAQDFGVPQTRKRVFLVGVRDDLGLAYRFPAPTHGDPRKSKGLLPFTSHGEAIRDLPLWPQGEFYERPHDPEGHWSWYYMSRNRKADWDSPSYTIVANWRHVTLHPASSVMKLTWSNLADNWKQRWDFANEYEHLASDPTRPVLEVPRRLSWRECARIQTFPSHFEPCGDTESKFEQIGNAVPPTLALALLDPLISGRALVEPARVDTRTDRARAAAQLLFWS